MWELPYPPQTAKIFAHSKQRYQKTSSKQSVFSQWFNCNVLKKNKYFCGHKTKITSIQVSFIQCQYIVCLSQEWLCMSLYDWTTTGILSVLSMIFDISLDLNELATLLGRMRKLFDFLICALKTNGGLGVWNSMRASN